MALSDEDWERLGQVVQWVVGAEVGKRVDAAVAELKAKATDLRDSEVDTLRRCLGVPPMADSLEQHREDALTGKAVRELLGLPEVD